jgi:hypothetical protein
MPGKHWISQVTYVSCTPLESRVTARTPARAPALVVIAHP